MTCPRLLALFGLLTLMGCASGQSGGQAQADAQTRAACRDRAEAAYNQQHRADIYSMPAAINTPSSGSYAPGNSGPGLSQLFIHDRMVSDCIRNTGTGADRAQPPAQP